MIPNARQFRVLAPFAAASMILLLVSTSRAFAQEHAGAATSEGARAGDGDGIKVHGHWTIDIKNPDGTLAAHHEFENALVTTGAATLARVLTHSSTQLLGWAIAMFPPGSQPITWVITESAATSFFPQSSISVSPNLTVAVGPSALDVVLQGSVQAPSASSIAMVDTGMVTQEPVNQQFHFFTERVLAQPITVQAGQIIQVMVLLSFS